MADQTTLGAVLHRVPTQGRIVGRCQLMLVTEAYEQNLQNPFGVAIFNTIENEGGAMTPVKAQGGAGTFEAAGVTPGTWHYHTTCPNYV